MNDATATRQGVVLAALHQCRVFEDLDRDVLRELVPVCTTHRFERNESLWLERGTTASLTLVLAGHFKLSKAALDAREVIAFIVGPGELVSTAASLIEAPQAMAAAALDDAVVLRVHRSHVRSLARTNREFMDALFRAQAEEMEALSMRAVEFATFSAEQRLALVFQRLAEAEGRRIRLEDDSMGVFVRIQLSRKDLAGLVNTRVETAIRFMSRWHREQIVQTETDGFLIRDLEAIRELSTPV